MTKQRIGYYDFLRGIAIIMVVGIHTCNKCGVGNVQEVMSLIFRELINCAVPLFITLSAFFMTRKMGSEGADRCLMLRRQVIKVYVPMLVWSLPFLIIGLSVGKSPIRQLTLFFTGGYSVYYFIALIIQCYAISFFVRKINLKGLAISGVITLAASVVIAYGRGGNLPILLYAGLFPVWIFFYALGIYLSDSDRYYSIKMLVSLMIMALLLQIVEGMFLKGLGCHIPFDATKPSSMIFSALVILILFSKKVESSYVTNKFTRVVEYIGVISFGIYLIHCHVIPLIPPFYWAFEWLLTLAISIMIVCGMRYILPAKVNYYLGM